MSPAVALIRRQSLRFRITLAFVATSALLALALSAATFYVIGSFLEDQRIRGSTRQTIFSLVFAREFLANPGRGPEQLVELLQSRASFQAIVTVPDDWFSTTLSITPDDVPDALARVVAGNRVAYQVDQVAGERWVVFGGSLPERSSTLYLFYSLEDIDGTMSVLARVLIVSSVVVVALAALAAQRLAGRILRPLGEVSGAAERIAEGLLETRVQAPSRDEVGLLAASFNEMAAALERMLERERRFVADVSHELRTPLTTLRAASELLDARRDELPPTAREAAQLVAEDVKSLQHFVEELLEISEFEAGKARIRWEPVDLRALASAVVEKRRSAAPVDGLPVTTVSDKARLERIVANLLDNSYAHGDGKDVRVSVAADDGWCSVSVSDRGPGIPDADIPKLFDRFYKTDPSRTRATAGIGLGLSIAMANARLLGGALDVRSRQGHGATFTLRLPLRDAPPAEPS